MLRSYKSRPQAFVQHFTLYLLLSLLTLFSFTSRLIAQNAVLQGVVPVNPPASGFAMDGDLKANVPKLGIGDWLPNTAASGGVLLGTGAAPAGSNRIFHKTDSYTAADNTFVGGLKKNGDLNGYAWKSAKTSPDKCDINNVLVHIGLAPTSPNPVYGLAGDT
ncbi:MAG: hypothetical protein H7296_13805, partial [Bacteroidia bacterium]|nr:hypothetical protein [Bacteroidia bacterium]